jgi:hypothetical protein
MGADFRPARRVDHRPRRSANPGRRPSTCRRSTSRRWRKRFKESKHKNTDLEVLKAAIRAQLEKLIA